VFEFYRKYELTTSHFRFDSERKILECGLKFATKTRNNSVFVLFVGRAAGGQHEHRIVPRRHEVAE
jgi:hypothetical protein